MAILDNLVRHPLGPVSYTHLLARQLEKGTVSKEFSKIDAIMGEDVEETGDFVVDEKDKVVNLTEDGVKKVEDFFHIENLADPENLEIQHNIIPVSYTHLVRNL